MAFNKKKKWFGGSSNSLRAQIQTDRIELKVSFLAILKTNKIHRRANVLLPQIEN